MNKMAIRSMINGRNFYGSLKKYLKMKKNYFDIFSFLRGQIKIKPNQSLLELISIGRIIKRFTNIMLLGPGK